MCFAADYQKRRKTKAEAAEEMAELMRRGGIYVTPGVIIALLDEHWRTVALLAHAIHDDWQPVGSAASHG